VDRGWAWAVRQIIPPPTIRSSEPQAFVVFWPMDKFIWWKKPWSHLGPPRIVATHLLSERELARCFRNGRRLDDAEEEFVMITFHRRDAERLRQHWEQIHRPPPLPGPNAARACG